MQNINTLLQLRLAFPWLPALRPHERTRPLGPLPRHSLTHLPPLAPCIYLSRFCVPLEDDVTSRFELNWEPMDPGPQIVPAACQLDAAFGNDCGSPAPPPPACEFFSSRPLAMAKLAKPRFGRACFQSPSSAGGRLELERRVRASQRESLRQRRGAGRPATQRPACEPGPCISAE